MNTYEDIMSLDPEKMNVTIWWKVFDMYPTPPNNDLKLLPDYCRDNNAAFSVINKLLDHSYDAMSGMDKNLNRTHIFTFYPMYGEPNRYRASAPTFAMAVCRAALLAILKIGER
jgi:hypothetical protein